MIAAGDQTAAEKQTEVQTILAAMNADQARDDVTYGKSRRVFKDKYINSNVSGGGL